MIIEGLLSLVRNLLELLLAPIQIPDLPESVQGVISQAMTYLLDGLGIFCAFTHYQFLITLLALVIIIDASMLIYKFVRWVLKKVPAAGIE